MRTLMAAALAAMTTPAMADMQIVCETPWAGIIDRLEITLPDGGVPIVTSAFVGDALATGFDEHPAVLGPTLTKTGPKADGTPFSSIMVESKVTENGRVYESPARIFYVDWGRAKVWTAFMSMVDVPGSKELEGCVRTD